MIAVKAGSERPVFTKSSDGPVSLLFNRRVSLLVSGPLARVGVSPNAATLMSLAIGGGAVAGYVLQIWWLGGLLAQLSSIFGGVDGEIARRTASASRYGDFLDTVVDRAVEYGVIAAIAVGLHESHGAWAWIVAVAALGGTFMLASASEKYRSTMHENYPKRQFEPFFAYVASGRDVRILIIAAASVAATFNTDVLFWSVAGVATAMHVNFAWRVVLLRGRMGE
jgi:CDP-L-myo-inositol myo-inositolphosphotransferase